MDGYSPVSRAKAPYKEAPAKTLPAVETEVLTSTDTDTREDSHVYVHCHFEAPSENALIRIWRTTYLIDQASGARSPLVHAENISIAPQWTMIPEGITFSFLLIFSALPKSCLQFDLKEEIAQPGGFHVRNIQRNETDVYHVNIG